MEQSVGIDEWKSRYFVLDDLHGIRIYDDKTAFRSGEPLRIIPANAIGKATRGTGLEYFEWGVYVHLLPTPDMMDVSDLVLETRAPSQNEMSRWLATLNMKGVYWHAGTTTRLSQESEKSAPPAASESIAPGERNYSSATSKKRYSVQVGLDLATSGRASTKMQLELASGWLTVKKEHSTLGGSKRRYCRLIGFLDTKESTNPPPPPGQNAKAPARPDSQTGVIYGGVCFYMLHKEKDALAKEQVGHGMLDMCEVTDVVKGRKSRIQILAGPRQVVVTADSNADQEMWTDALYKHRGLLPYLATLPAGGAPAPKSHRDDGFLSERISVQSTLRPSDIKMSTRVSQFMELPVEASDGNKRLTAWMEFAEAGAELEFTLGYVALLKDSCLGYFNAASATNGPPIKSLDLSEELTVTQLDDPPYNYEHAFEVTGKKGGPTWVLCPDSPDESELWMAALKQTFGQS